MAYIDKHFNAIGGETRSGVNGTLFYYRTEDNEATLVAPDYFNSLKKILKKGDIIEVLLQNSLSYKIVSSVGKLKGCRIIALHPFLQINKYYALKV